jgi:dephospho-CoA kinase
MKHTLNVTRQVTVTKIALTGKMRAGKDEIAQHLYIKYGFKRIAFGDELKRTAGDVFPWMTGPHKPRALLQQYGQLMREIDPQVWVKHADRKVKGEVDFRVNSGHDRVGIVITDLRQQNEYDWARANGFTIIRVTAPDDVRIDRAIRAGDNFSENDLEHVTESAIDGFEVDAVIINKGSLEELQTKIDVIMEQIMKEAID